jgi:tetratricopeptide (TPR) repeat protein/ADP-heptose:LPS heptosyltransferase
MGLRKTTMKTANTSSQKMNGKPLERARAALQAGEAKEVEKNALAVLKNAPRNAEALEMLAMAKLLQGHAEAAQGLLRDVVAISPENLNATINLGNILISAKKYQEALVVFDTALKQQPRRAHFHVSRGVVLDALDRHDESLQSYAAALQIEPDNADALSNSGTLLGKLNRHAEAIACYQHALTARPDFPEALNNLAVSFAQLGRREEALDCYGKALVLKPGYADALKNRTELLALMGRNERALEGYDALIALQPAVAELHNNRGTVLSALNRHQESLPGYEEALRLKPDYPDALNNRGIALAALNRFEDALQCFRSAIQLQPDYVTAHWNEALTLLRLGQFREGWQKHEWRWKKPEFKQYTYNFTQPLWLGKEALEGKTLLLLAEQGYGDVIQFCRYIPMIEARGAKVLLFVPEALGVLLQTSFPRASVFSKVAAFPHFDFYCPILSLPLAFGTLVETIPANLPYLLPPADRLPRWRGRIGNGLRVGLVWAGSASHKNDINRSIRLADFGKLMNLEGIRFFVLQKELSGEEREVLSNLPAATLLGDELKDFADTAAAIANLDLVITVDTSVAHLAAALGKPTWILLSRVADWRWMPGRTDSPWYPDARLYWQEEIGAWTPVLQRVVQDLRRFCPQPIAAQKPAAIGSDDAIKTALDFLRNGNPADAEAICAAVLLIDPGHFDAHQLMGTLLLQQKKIGKAIEHFEIAVNLKPENVDALTNLSGALRLDNRHQEALHLYDRASSLAPDSPAIPTNRAVSLIALKRYPEALSSIDIALARDPRNIAALNNRGVILNQTRRYLEALDCFDAALRIKPDYVDAVNNRGLSLIALNRLKEAEESYARLLRKHPGYEVGWSNRGLALASLNRNQEALECFHQALASNPEYVDAHWNQSLISLVLGNFAEGWAKYEWRWKKPEFAPHKREFHLPLWTGKEDLRGRTLFVHYEQGFGDVIQFVRYLDLLDAAGAKVLLSVPVALRKLVESSFPKVAVYCEAEVLPPFDYHCPMLSLPLAFSTTLETIPSRSPYLQVPEDHLAHWAAVIPSGKALKIGIVWSGNPAHQNDHNRSISVARLQALLQTHGCHFYALQKEVCEEDRKLLQQDGVAILGDRFSDFSDTAAAIMQLDLVISVDTSVAHLAGALGKPLWLLLPFAPDWRWLLEREDSPWYPSARLFRQAAPGNSDAQVESLTAALAVLAASRGD